MITQSRLKDILLYDKYSGIFSWNIKTSPRCQERVGSMTDSGYIRIMLNNTSYRAHRLAFLYMTGSMPEQVDHIDHNRSNNIWSNLRPATNQINRKNQSINKNNKSGVMGVGWMKSKCKFRARIQSEGKQIHLGLFDSFEEAVMARKEAEVQYGFHANHNLKD